MVKLIDYIKARVNAAAAGVGVAGHQHPSVKQETTQQQQQQGSKPRPGSRAAAVQQSGGASCCTASSSSCSGIVYCLSRKEAENVAAVLREEGGIKAEHYHAGMTPKQRTEVRFLC